jgi:hypothetical protein
VTRGDNDRTIRAAAWDDANALIAKLPYSGRVSKNAALVGAYAAICSERGIQVFEEIAHV